MARLIYAPRFLECLKHRSPLEVRRCLHERDLEILRLFLYAGFSYVIETHGCRSPYTAGLYDHSTVFFSFHDCGGKTEDAIWSLVWLLEKLPGVWYVETRREGDKIMIRTISYRDLYE